MGRPCLAPGAWPGSPDIAGTCDRLVLLELLGGALPFANALRLTWPHTRGAPAAAMKFVWLGRLFLQANTSALCTICAERTLRARCQSVPPFCLPAPQAATSASSEVLRVLRPLVQTMPSRLCWMIAASSQKHAQLLQHRLGVAFLRCSRVVRVRLKAERGGSQALSLLGPVSSCGMTTVRRPLFRLQSQRTSCPTDGTSRGTATKNLRRCRMPPRPLLSVFALMHVARSLPERCFKHCSGTQKLQLPPCDPTDRNSVERRRVSLLTKALPVCG